MVFILYLCAVIKDDNHASDMKLSIITITYKDPDGLRKTWESLRCQTWRDWEWIVIDGGSGPEVEQFLRDNDSEIAYWCSEPDKGIYNAMNKGIAQARGERLLFMNSADILIDQDILARVYATPMEADIVYGDTIYDWHSGSKYETYPDQPSLCYFLEHSLCHQSSFIRRRLLTEKGYDESLRIVSDWKRFLELFLDGCTFCHLPFAVSVYDTKGISTNSVELCMAERDRVLHEIFPERVLVALWNSANTPPNMREYVQQMNKRWIYKRIIRSSFHLLRWIDAHFPMKEK